MATYSKTSPSRRAALSLREHFCGFSVVTALGLLLALALFSTLPARAATVNIGENESKKLSDLLISNPNLSLSDIKFTSKNSARPGTLVIDAAYIWPQRMLNSDQYGKITVNSGFTANFSGLSKTRTDGAYLGGWFYSKKDLTFAGEGSLIFDNNYVTGYGGAMYSEGGLFSDRDQSHNALLRLTWEF